LDFLCYKIVESGMCRHTNISYKKFKQWMKGYWTPKKIIMTREILFSLLLSWIGQTCLSQEKDLDCIQMGKNDKRYDVNSGTLTYTVYATNSKRKKKGRLFDVVVEFRDYGKVQEVMVTQNDSVSKYSIVNDSSNVVTKDGFFLNYFIPDRCSYYYKGILLDKKINEESGGNYAKYLVYSFATKSGNGSSGSVKYYKKIPVYIRGWDFTFNRIVIWELTGLPDR
jgi:hypothetical protein